MATLTGLIPVTVGTFEAYHGGGVGEGYQWGGGGLGTQSAGPYIYIYDRETCRDYLPSLFLSLIYIGFT